MNTPVSTNYLTDLRHNLKWVETHRRALSEAAHHGDLLAGVIISRTRDLASGDYRPSAIEAFNLECAGWRKGQGE